MFRTIFQRLLVTYLLLALLIISGFSIAISIGYNHYFFSEKEITLRAIAEKAKELSISYENGEIGQDQLNTSIDALGDSSDSLIYILKIKSEDIPADGSLNISGLEDKVISEDIMKVIGGQELFKKSQYSEAFGMDVLLLGYPIHFNTETNGAVLLMHPLDSINKNLQEINRYIWLAALITFMVSVPLIYFNSSKISNPIAKIEHDAMRIAAGEDFEPAVIISRDEIGRLSKSFCDMKQEIDKTDQMRRDLIANISHELRTPLTSINGFAQGMIDGIVPKEKEQHYLGIIKDESQRLIGLTSEILELAKIQSGNVKLNLTKQNLKDALDTIIDSLDFSSHSKEIEIDNLVSSQIDVMVDSARLRQITINLLANAIHYSEEKAKIHLTARPEGDLIRLSIQDEGIGVNDSDLPLIFDRFYRSDSSGSQNEGGSGIGLSVVKELVCLLGGTIRADRNPSGGLIISFTLPAQ